MTEVFHNISQFQGTNVVVASVEASSVASLHIHSGDTLVEVNEKRVSDITEAKKVVLIVKRYFYLSKPLLFAGNSTEYRREEYCKTEDREGHHSTKANRGPG